MARASSVISVGLSPLARGTPHTIITTSIRIRFIPAGAGNTTYAELAEEEEPVYPRWRGEHNFCSMSLTPIAGLSPLAREHVEIHGKKIRISGLSPLARGTLFQSTTRGDL